MGKNDFVALVALILRRNLPVRVRKGRVPGAGWEREGLFQLFSPRSAAALGCDWGVGCPPEVPMPRSLNLHPLSLLAGAFVAGFAFLSMAQTPVLNARGVVVGYGPDPRDMVQIKGGQAFTVPPGKLLVLTALGSASAPPYSPIIKVNGEMELWADGSPSCSVPISMASLPIGFTVPAGSSVELGDQQGGPSQQYRAWGYLAPQ